MKEPTNDPTKEKLTIVCLGQDQLHFPVSQPPSRRDGRMFVGLSSRNGVTTEIRAVFKKDPPSTLGPARTSWYSVDGVRITQPIAYWRHAGDDE